jgi:hypothetical protein
MSGKMLILLCSRSRGKSESTLSTGHKFNGSVPTYAWGTQRNGKTVHSGWSNCRPRFNPGFPEYDTGVLNTSWHNDSTHLLQKYASKAYG